MKISIIGSSGRIAGQLVQQALSKNTFPDLELMLLSHTPESVRAGVMDCYNAIAFADASERASLRPPAIRHSADRESIAGSDIIFLCAGKAPTPEEKDAIKHIDPSGRLAASFINAPLVYDVAANIAQHSPDSTVIILTNQSDTMASIARLHLPPENVLGFGGMLDTSRFKIALADILSNQTGQPLSPHDIQAEIIGAHNDDMVLVSNSIKVPAGFRNHLEDNPEYLNHALDVTKRYGRAISENTTPRTPDTNCGSYIAPAAACWEMISAMTGQRNTSILSSFNIVPNEKQQRFYGIPKDTEASLPVRIGADGIQPMVGTACTPVETRRLQNCIINLKSYEETALSALGLPDTHHSAPDLTI